MHTKATRILRKALAAIWILIWSLIWPDVLSAEESADKRREEAWNDTRLLEWVATIGDAETRYDDLATVRSFELLQRSLEELKQMVLHDAQNEQEAIEGLRMILKHLAMSTRDSIDNDFMNPLFDRRDPRHRDVGAYNPDAEYDQVPIDGRYDYKLSGNLGSVPYVSITVNGSDESRQSRMVGYLDDDAIRKHASADGRYTLWLTKQKPAEPGAWIQLPDEANGVVIRQYVASRERDTLARFAIEAVGKNRPAVDQITDEEVATRIAKTANAVVVGATWHRTLLPEMLQRPNEFVAATGTAIGATAANSENYYQMAHFQLDPGEVLVVDFEPPTTRFWNLTSATIWHESHRYLTDPASRTLDEVTKQKDGRVRFIVADRDPGEPNWIKTFGHTRGFLILRIVGVTSHPKPVVRRIPAKDLPALLGSRTGPWPAPASEGIMSFGAQPPLSNPYQHSTWRADSPR